MDDQRVFISVKEAARRLAISPWLVYQLCERGELASRYIGRRRVIEPEAVKAYAEGLPTERPATEPA